MQFRLVPLGLISSWTPIKQVVDLALRNAQRFFP
jgi:hypothetical protein